VLLLNYKGKRLTERSLTIRKPPMPLVSQEVGFLRDKGVLLAAKRSLLIKRYATLL
jgi:hypothetical protein